MKKNATPVYHWLVPGLRRYRAPLEPGRRFGVCSAVFFEISNLSAKYRGFDDRSRRRKVLESGARDFSTGAGNSALIDTTKSPQTPQRRFRPARRRSRKRQRDFISSPRVVHLGGNAMPRRKL